MKNINAGALTNFESGLARSNCVDGDDREVAVEQACAAKAYSRPTYE